MSNFGDNILLATRKGLLIFSHAGGRWQLAREAHAGVTMSYAAVDRRSGTLWACFAEGHWGPKLRRSADLGETWEELPPPVYPQDAKLRDGNPFEPDEGEPRFKPATMKYLWVLEAGGDDEPGRIYIGTEPGGLFVSDAGGDAAGESESSFQLCDPLWNHPSRLDWFGGGRDNAGIHSVVVDPRDSRRVLVGVSCAGVFETTDAGASWQPRNKGLKATFLPDPEAEIGHDPHLLMACRNHPDVLWQQNHCGIFRSTDGGANWQEISDPEGPANFGFVVQADPDDPQTAWVVPAVSDQQRVAIDRALCVCRTEDGGASWQTLRQGLPQQNCFDFVFRHGMDQAGDRLALATATGALYVSEDRGDSWQCLGEHLPPIYSARFA